MRKLLASIGVAGIAASLLFAASGVASADINDSSTRDNHSTPNCQPHLLNIATCVGPVFDGPAIEVGNIL
jgi:hypothetical protein